MNTCVIPGCARLCRSASGWCQWHLDKMKRYGTPTPGCTADDCHEPLKARGYCARHLQKYRNHGTPYYTTRLPLEPLEAWFTAHGGVGHALTAAGFKRDTLDRERLEKLVDNYRDRGYYTVKAADDLAVEVFGVHPAVIYGDAWWIRFDMTEEELIAS